MKSKQSYIPQLTFPRFLAALLVIVFHFAKDVYPFNTFWLNPIVDNGNLAVSFFFFLSGLVLYVNYYDKEFTKRDFYYKRFIRIYPMYFLALVLIIFIAFFMNYGSFNFDTLLLHFSMLQSWFPKHVMNLNFPGWTISVEMFFYLMFPFILYRFKKCCMNMILWLSYSVWLISFLIFFGISFFINEETVIVKAILLYFPLWHINGFIFGMFCGKLIVEPITTKTKKLVFFNFILGLGTAILILIIGEKRLCYYGHNGLFSPLFVVGCYYLANSKGWLVKLISKKTFLVLGEASYALYILQWPVYIFAMLLLDKKALMASDFYLYLSMLLVLSILFYRFYEKPLHRKLKSIKIKKQLLRDSKV